MNDLAKIIAPELILSGIACVLFLLGCSNKTASRRLAPFLALAALVAALLTQLFATVPAGQPDLSLRMDLIAGYLRPLTIGVAIMLLLLAWPTNAEQTGNSAMEFGHEAGEFFALFILSIAGLLLVTVANDLIMLFLALELVSIPTYIMVSISRPIAIAQEAGVKYFFLGALSVALMLFGFSYLYGGTGQINLPAIASILRQSIAANAGALPAWEKLGVVLIVIGLAFKMAAFPLHFYAGDVYEGAATPVSAFLAFVPKTAGFAALLKILHTVGGDSYELPRQMSSLLWALAALTMSFGNVLGLLQNNVKRVLAYSSIAHSGYMLVGVAALSLAPTQALEGVLFYLAAYGIMNAGAFGVLMLLPSRDGRSSAETFEDLAGIGRSHVALGLAMAVSCFSLIGLPLTVGFFGKLMLIRSALDAKLLWLVIILVINAAVSAAYYLRIVTTMFLRPQAAGEESVPDAPIGRRQWTVIAAVGLSVIGVLVLGTIPAATEKLTGAVHGATEAGPVQTSLAPNRPSPPVDAAGRSARISALDSGRQSGGG
jgi:NADH-quinone oxidoreductase subunit N